MADSRGVVKNIDVLVDVAEDDEDVRAEEDCDSDSDTLSNMDARQQFQTRSIRDLSLGNFRHFKFLNSEEQLSGRFNSVKISPKANMMPSFKPEFPQHILPINQNLNYSSQNVPRREFYMEKGQSPRQLPPLDQYQNRSTLLNNVEGMGTPKFKETESSQKPTPGEFYKRKRQIIQARKELFAMENYRSETNAGRHGELASDKMMLSSIDDTCSRTKMINTMELRVKHITSHSAAVALDENDRASMGFVASANKQPSLYNSISNMVDNPCVQVQEIMARASGENLHSLDDTDDYENQ